MTFDKYLITIHYGLSDMKMKVTMPYNKYLTSGMIQNG